MVSLGMPASRALDIASIPRSTYYYKSTGGRKGRRPEGHTLLNGQVVPDSQVIRSVYQILSQDFID